MNELLWMAMLLVNFGAILISYRIWGKAGLYLWVPIAVIVANIQVTKTVELFGLTATLGNIVYATSFLVTDILNENYGKKDAAKAVGMGFFSLIILTVLMNLALKFTPDSSDFAHGSLATIFSIMPRIAVGSLVAYGISQLHDIWAYDFWRKRFPSIKFIWLRNNLSTMVSQMLDTVIFTFIAFWGVFDSIILIDILITTYLLKLVVALLDTPFLYIARNWHDRRVVDREK